MLRRILGIIAGWLSGAVLGAILFMILVAVLGKDGLVTAEETPTTASLVIMCALGAVTAYLMGAIARAIGKDKLTIFIFLGLIVVLSVVSMILKGSATPPEDTPIPPETPEFFKTLAAFGKAQMKAPAWLGIANAALSLLGIALGGLNKADFDKAAPASGSWSEPPGPSTPA